MMDKLTIIMIAIQFVLIFVLAGLFFQLSKEMKDQYYFMKTLLGLQEDIVSILKDLNQVDDPLYFDPSELDFDKLKELESDDPFYGVPVALNVKLVKDLKKRLNGIYGCNKSAATIMDPISNCKPDVSVYKTGPIADSYVNSKNTDDELILARYFEHVKDARE